MTVYSSKDYPAPDPHAVPPPYRSRGFTSSAIGRLFHEETKRTGGQSPFIEGSEDDDQADTPGYYGVDDDGTGPSFD